MKINRLLNLKLWLCVGAIALANTVGTAMKLDVQHNDLRQQGRFKQASWERYEDYAWELSSYSSVAGIVGLLVVALWVPDSIERSVRQAVLTSYVKARMASPKPLTDEQLQIFSEILGNENSPE